MNYHLHTTWKVGCLPFLQQDLSLVNGKDRNGGAVGSCWLSTVVQLDLQTNVSGFAPYILGSTHIQVPLYFTLQVAGGCFPSQSQSGLGLFPFRTRMSLPWHHVSRWSRNLQCVSVHWCILALTMTVLSVPLWSRYFWYSLRHFSRRLSIDHSFPSCVSFTTSRVSHCVLVGSSFPAIKPAVHSSSLRPR